MRVSYEDEDVDKYLQSLAEWGIESGTILQLEGEGLSAQLVLLQAEDQDSSPKVTKKRKIE